MDGKNGELGKIQKNLQENQAPTQAGPLVPGQQPPVATEVTKRPTEGKPFLDEAAKKEMLAKAPDEKAFDQKIINDQVNQQLAVYYDSKSSDAQRATAKSKIDELYKLRDRQEEIKKALYGTNPAVNKVAPAKGTKRVADNTSAESQPTIKSTSAVEKTVTSNPAPTPDTTVAPKLPGDMTEMAAIARGKSLSDIGSIGVRNTTTAELGQTWKVKVDPKADMPEIAKPINPAEFQTSGTATGSFHGRFGGFAEPHPEGVTPSWSHYEKESDSKPATTSANKVSAEPKDSTGGTAVKATRKSQNAKAEEWKLPEYEAMRKEESETASPLASKTGSKTKSSKTAERKEQKLTKAEKEIEARTHSDSMLGPVIPGAEPDTRTEEEKLQGDAWEKEFRGPGKSERSKDVEPPKTPEEVEYEKARAEWYRVRNYFNGEIIDKRPTGIEAEFNQKYAEFLEKESKGWRGLVTLPRRMLGLSPRLSPEMQRMADNSRFTRETYFKKADELRLLREKLPRRGNLSDEQREKAFARYEAMLARKLILKVKDDRSSIQIKAFETAREQSRLRPMLETVRKYRYARWAATGLGVAALGGLGALGATGGVLAAAGVAGLAGGGYGLRLAAGVGAGIAWGKRVDKAEKIRRGQLLGELEGAKANISENLFDTKFDEAESNIDAILASVNRNEAIAKTVKIGGAVATGFLAGNLTGHIADSLDIFPQSPIDSPHPKWEGSTTNTPKYVYGQSVGEGGMVSGPPPAESGSIRLTDAPDPKLQGVPADLRGVELPSEAPIPQSRPVEFMGDMKVSEAMQPEVEEGIKEILAGEKNGPYISTPGQAPIPEPRPEMIDSSIHTVVKGENAWHIMRDESSVLKGMSLAEQNKWQVELWNSLTRDEAIDAGFVRSGGDVDKIFEENVKLGLPADKINVSMLDERLLELMHQDKAGNIPVPEPRPDMMSATDPVMPDGTPLEEVEPHEPIETDVPGPDEFPEHGPVSVQGKDGVYVVEGRTADVNQMTLRDASNLLKGVMVDDPNALALLEEMNTDKTSFLETVDSFVHRAGKDGTMNLDLTVTEWMNNSDPIPRASQPPSFESVPAANDNVPMRQASVSGAEVMGGQSLESYVRSVEQPKNGFLDNLFGLGKPDVDGTLAQLRERYPGLTVGNIKDMAAGGTVPEGINETGFEVWAKEVAGAPANDNNKTLVEYVSGLANSRVA